MRDELANVMLRNLQEMLNEREAARRTGGVKSIRAKEAEFFEGAGA